MTSLDGYNAASGGTLVGQTVQGFDGVGNITGITHKDGNGNTLESFTYSYDPGNRVTSETDFETGVGTTTKNYTYDGSNQLTSAGGTNYNYDLNGNRNSAQYQIDAGNQYDTDGNWNYVYDAAGNLAEKDGVAGTQYAGLVWKYGYDGFERLNSATETNNGTQVDQENISYDVFGNRVEEDVTKNGTTTVSKQAYDANGVCYADISGTGSIVTRRVNLDAVDALFARIGQTGTIAWYLTDHLGSVTGLMNNSGSLIDGLVYDAYGNVTNETSPSNGDRYAFTGRERDVETGLQYNRARWYDPATGRWITQDPLGFDAGDSNLYRYVNNGPTLVTDPSGLQELPRFRPFYPFSPRDPYSTNYDPRAAERMGWKRPSPLDFLSKLPPFSPQAPQTPSKGSLNTGYGTWDWVQISTNGSVGAGYTSNMTITFTPNPKTVKSNDVTFVQLVRHLQIQPNLQTTNANTVPNYVPRLTDEFWAVDRVENQKYGFYVYGNDSTPVEAWGSIGDSTKVVPAVLKDTAGGAGPDQTWQFQTFAIAKDGNGGKVLSGLSWGFTVDGRLRLTNSGPALVTNYQDFKASIQKWNEQADGPVNQRNHPEQIKFGDFTFP